MGAEHAELRCGRPDGRPLRRLCKGNGYEIGVHAPATASVHQENASFTFTEENAHKPDFQQRLRSNLWCLKIGAKRKVVGDGMIDDPHIPRYRSRCRPDNHFARRDPKVRVYADKGTAT